MLLVLSSNTRTSAWYKKKKLNALFASKFCVPATESQCSQENKDNEGPFLNFTSFGMHMVV
jgi:hypothetical protein